MNVVKTLMLAASAAAVVGAMPAQAFEPSNLTVRVRAINIDPADKSGAVAAIGLPKDKLDVEKKWAPDLDFEYALSPNWGVELLLSLPQKHEVIARQTALGNNVSLGSVTHLPPTLTAKYYFATGAVRPYVGAGVNVTWFTKDRLAVPTVGTLDVDDWSFGLAGQAGIDFQVNEQWHVSLDAKYAQIDTGVSLGGTKLTTVDVNPWILGIGVGYRLK